MTGWHLEILVSDGAQTGMAWLAQVDGAELPLASRAVADRLASILQGSIAWLVEAEDGSVYLKVGLDRHRPYPVLLVLSLLARKQLSPTTVWSVSAVEIVEVNSLDLDCRPPLPGILMEGLIDPLLAEPTWWDKQQETLFWQGLFQPEGRSQPVPAVLVRTTSPVGEPILRLIIARGDRHEET
jgi:hypothetical protein